MTWTRARPRKLRKVMIGKRAVLTAGLKPSLWNDVYHVAMTARLPVFTAGLAAAFLVTNAVFALLYWLVPGCIANSGDNLENLFYFSVETITTVGYGELFPQTRFAHMIVGIEVFTGLFFTATMLGLIFARMSRPRARLLFARCLTVGPHEGEPTLSVRVANARLNIMSSANARLWVLLSETTTEGTRFRRFVELPLLRAENPTFALSWTMLHRIDESSPLFGRTADALIQDDALIVVNITGHDESSGQAVQARETYLASDVRFGHRYMDILSASEDGQTLLDYSRFHDIEPVPAAVNGSAPVTRSP
ncbi:MAG: ion channel [Janthinobacterium lividum]